MQIMTEVGTRQVPVTRDGDQRRISSVDALELLYVYVGQYPCISYLSHDVFRLVYVHLLSSFLLCIGVEPGIVGSTDILESILSISVSDRVAAERWYVGLFCVLLSHHLC